jgi:hypothetical protein
MGLDGAGVAEKVDESMAQAQDEQQGREDGIAQTATPPADGVRAFDAQGRQVIVPREEWRTNVIPGMVKESWENPDQLYMVILNSLNDGFGAEMGEASARLYEIDTVPARGVCMLGIVMIQTGRLDEAETLLSEFLEKRGEDASVLVNLAKVYAEKGDKERARTTLARAIEIEPNHDNGLGWYASLEQERGGDEAAHALLVKVAAQPNSWRALLWLARGALNAGNLITAKQHYFEALGRVSRPVPPDFMMQMSGDLGAKGHLAELIDLTLPNFNPEWHGMPVGNNLIKALADSGNLNVAEQVKASLWAMNRPDWREALAFWDADIARRRLAGGGAAQPQPQELQVGMLRVDGPIWLPPGSPAKSLFAPKSPAAPTVTFLGGSAEAPEASDAQAAFADHLGRMTRSLPLFFAEQVEMRTAAAGRAMVPWAVAPVSGFVVSGRRWDDNTAVQAVAAQANASDYVVTVHVDAEVEPWTAMLAFIRTQDGTTIGELEKEFDHQKPEEGLAELADEVVELLGVLGTTQESPAYEVPGPATFGSYLLRLEQLLAVRCANMDGVVPQFLNGETEILQGELDLCVAEPQNVPARLLLRATLGALAKVKPQAVEEFAGSFEKLTTEHPLPAVDSLAP